MPSRSSSRSDGEIQDSDSALEDKKATKPSSSSREPQVDRQNRKRTLSRSPTPTSSIRSSRQNDRSRSRSPYRNASHTSKRQRNEDDHYSKGGDRRDRKGSRLQYDDRKSNNSYRRRSPRREAREGRFRSISRSPPRFNNRADQDIQSRGRSSREQSVSREASASATAALSKTNTEKLQSEKSVSFQTGTKDVDDGGATESVDTAQAETEPLTEAELIEQRRKRREAIKAKHRNQPSLLVQVLDPTATITPVDSAPSTPGSLVGSLDSMSVAPGTPEEISTPNSPAFDVISDIDLANANSQAAFSGQGEASAADYDPTQDMQEDRLREGNRHNNQEVSTQEYDETKNNNQDVLVPEASANDVDEFDMFAEDANDMFADAPILKAPTKAFSVPKAAIDMSMLDDWDDEDGYYKIIMGELLDNRYHVQMNLGKGMFSAVVRATDQSTGKLVAIKIIRSNDTMRKAAAKEIDILGKLMASDPDDKKHVIRLERSFEHKGHLCMVFENLSINLREVLKKFGRDVGINIRAVRLYAHQMFLGLSLLRKCNIIHADLKPDNILVNDSRNFLKVCDLGSASDASDNEITPYLVSRFYRAPEIILGLPYDFAIDTWSVGCTLYELFTGKILFTGRNNNQMLRSIMECRGKFSPKQLRKAEFAPLHFDDLLNFRSMEKDKISGKDVVKMYSFAGKPTRDLRGRIMAGNTGGTESDMKEMSLFLDLLEKCLALNPEKRITPMEALKHPFILRPKI